MIPVSQSSVTSRLMWQCPVHHALAVAEEGSTAVYT
jgi:hypothetical protein